MDDPFDPYLEWLRIPADEQPPHHYCLLGIPLFESDQRIIAEAALDVATILRRYQLSDKVAISGRLLGEVARAKTCLLDPERKRDYDTELTEKLQLPTTARPLPLPSNPPSMPTTAEAVSFDAKQDPNVKPGRKLWLRFGIFAAFWLVVGLAGWGTYATITAHQVEITRKQAAQETEAKQKQDEEVQRRAEKERKQKEEGQRAEEERKRKVAEQRAEEERKRLEEEQRAEEERKRLEEEQRAEEERKRLEEEQRAEKQRRATEQAKREAARKEQEHREKQRKRLEAQQRVAEERRFREEHPEEYLESLGLIKRSDSWQLASNDKLEGVFRELKNVENKIRNKKISMAQKVKKAEKEYKHLSEVLHTSFRTSSFNKYFSRYGTTTTRNVIANQTLLNTLIDHMIEGQVASRGTEYTLYTTWLTWARTQKQQNTRYTLDNYCGRLRKQYWKEKDVATDAKEAYADSVEETLTPVYRKLETSIAEVRKSRESLDRDQKEVGLAVQRAGGKLDLKVTDHQLKAAEKQKTKTNEWMQMAAAKKESAKQERKDANKRRALDGGGTGSGLF